VGILSLGTFAGSLYASDSTTPSFYTLKDAIYSILVLVSLGLTRMWSRGVESRIPEINGRANRIEVMEKNVRELQSGFLDTKKDLLEIKENVLAFDARNEKQLGVLGKAILDQNREIGAFFNAVEGLKVEVSRARKVKR